MEISRPHVSDLMYISFKYSEFAFSVVCVAGAGRGPLVARCLSAIERSQREAFVYAVEKNPNAYVKSVSPFMKLGRLSLILLAAFRNVKSLSGILK